MKENVSTEKIIKNRKYKQNEVWRKVVKIIQTEKPLAMLTILIPPPQFHLVTCTFWIGGTQWEHVKKILWKFHLTLFSGVGVTDKMYPSRVTEWRTDGLGYKHIPDKTVQFRYKDKWCEQDCHWTTLLFNTCHYHDKFVIIYYNEIL